MNWTSFYTASGPEDHGVFGFTRINPQTYELAITDSTLVGAKSIFEILGAKGIYSKVINLPNTYPARPLNGMLVSGFVAMELEQAVYPKFLSGPLRGIDYVLEADTTRGAKDPEFLLSELDRCLDSRLRALDLFWADLEWDLFVFVLTETDRLFHFLFTSVEDETHPQNAGALAFFAKWDQVIGAVLDRYERIEEPKRLISLADHGFTSLITEVDINTWLMNNNYLFLSREPAHEMDSCIGPGTAAFALDPGRIYINSASRFPHGQVGEQDRPIIAGRIMSGLEKLTYKGHRVFRKIHWGHELYQGKFTPIAPDIVCEPMPGFDLKAKFDRDEIFGFFGRDGTHTKANAFFMDTKGETARRVRDVGCLVLDHFENE